MPSLKPPKGFPVKQFRVFAIFGLLVTCLAFMPAPLDLLPSVNMFFKRLFGQTATSKGKAPPKLNAITDDIEKLEAKLSAPPPKTAKSTPGAKSLPRPKRPPVKRGALQKIAGAKFLSNPCIDGGKSGCRRWALDAFYASLNKSAQKKAVTRIGYFGDSIIALDKVTSKLRDKFQERFGNSGPGFFHMASVWKWSRHRQISNFSREWKTETMLFPRKKMRYFGYGGVIARTIGPGARTTLKIREGAETSVDRMAVFYVKNVEGGKFHINVDGKRLKTVNTRGPRQEGQMVEVTFEKGSAFEVEAGRGGVLELTGVLLEKRSPGVVIDSMSLTGGRLYHFGNPNKAHLSTSLKQRDPDLLVFHFGLNEADTGIEPDYEQRVSAFLDTVLKQRSNLSCAIAGPSDKVKKKYGEYVTQPIIHYVIKVQKKLALQAGCAFFNTWQAMGGETSIVKWYNHRPRLAIGDLTHITDAGGDLLGSLIYLELMKGYHQWLREQKGNNVL